uniref:PLCXc domain-containing protein n=1 Tax=Mesocestoides corti TaxID=53468 RepID=A0A5K3FI20_MESCO
MPRSHLASEAFRASVFRARKKRATTITPPRRPRCGAPKGCAPAPCTQLTGPESEVGAINGVVSYLTDDVDCTGNLPVVVVENQSGTNYARRTNECLWQVVSLLTKLTQRVRVED